MIRIEGILVGFFKLKNVVFLCGWSVQVEQCTVHHRRWTLLFRGIVATLSQVPTGCVQAHSACPPIGGQHVFVGHHLVVTHPPQCHISMAHFQLCNGIL